MNSIKLQGRTLTYWVAECLYDSQSYNIREKTRREVIVALKSESGDYGKPQKITVRYSDLMDLIRQALGEGGIEGVINSSPPSTG